MVLREEIKEILGRKEYVKLQLKTAENLIRKARWSNNEREIVSCLLALSSLIEDCLDVLEVEKWEEKNLLK